MEKVLVDIRDKIVRQNFAMELYGYHSYEFQVARIILNTTLESLYMCNFITSYHFDMCDDTPHIITINRIFIELGVVNVSIDEQEIKYL